MAENQDSGYFAMLNGDGTSILISVIGMDTHVLKRELTIFAKDFEGFIEIFPRIFDSSIKCIIFNVFCCSNLVNPDNILFCNQLKDQVEKQNIPYYFCPTETIIPVSFLLSTHLICELGEVVIIAFLESEKIRSYVYLREAEGYQNVHVHILSSEHIKDKKKFRSAFFQEYKAKFVVVYSNSFDSPSLQALRNIVHPSQFRYVHNIPLLEPTIITEMCKWRLNPLEHNQYFIKARSTRRYYASFSEDISDNIEMVIDYNEKLPLERKYVFPRTKSLLYISYSNAGESLKQPFQTCKLESSDCHRKQLNISIDENNFPKTFVEHRFIDEILSLPSMLDEAMQDKHPVIAFFDNSSVICVFNAVQNKYIFLEAWNGKYGKDIFLNLKPDKKPILEYKQPLDSTSVINFYELCTFTKCQEHAPLNDGIRIVQSLKGEIMLEFDTLGGSPKRATPTFLMALIIREHYSVIKHQTGIRHDKLGILSFPKFPELTKVEEGRKPFYQYLGRYFQTMEKHKEIQSFLKESCNMLRVQYSENASLAIDIEGHSFEMNSLQKS